MAELAVGHDDHDRYSGDALDDLGGFASAPRPEVISGRTRAQVDRAG